jgi:hypothetical protein
MDALENVSVIVSMVSYVLDIGSLTIKSMAIEVNGSVNVSEGMGKMGGFGFVGWFFQDWHSVQPLIYSVTVCLMFGHQ